MLPALSDAAEAVDVGELDPVDPFHGEDVAGGQLPLDLRHPEALVGGGELGHLGERRRLQPQVHLHRDRAGEGVDDRDRLQPPDGRVDREVRLPVSQVTCPCLGGPDLRTMFITSAHQGLSEAQRKREPLAGSCFVVEVDVPGLPESALKL